MLRRLIRTENFLVGSRDATTIAALLDQTRGLHMAKIHCMEDRGWMREGESAVCDHDALTGHIVYTSWVSRPDSGT